MKIEVINTMGALSGLEDEWKKLESELPHKTPYQTWGWQNAWVHTKQIEKRLFVLAVRDSSDSLVGVAPFQKVSIFPGCYVITFIGQEASISQDFLLMPGKEKDVLRAVFSFVDAKSCILGAVLKMVSYQHSSYRALENVFNTLGVISNDDGFSECVSLKLSKTYDEFLAELNSKMRQEMRAARRKLDEKYSPDFIQMDLNNDCQATLGELFDLNERRWGKSGGRSVHESLYPVLIKAGMLKIFLLRIEGQSVAALSVLISDNSIFAELAGFNYYVESRHLGKYFYGKVIEWGINEGYKTLDLSSGDESYKRRLKPDVYVKHRIIISGSSVKYKLVQLVRRLGRLHHWLRIDSLA